MAQTTASHYYQLWSLYDPPGILQESFRIVRVHKHCKEYADTTSTTTTKSENDQEQRQNGRQREAAAYPGEGDQAELRSLGYYGIASSTEGLGV